MKDLTIGFIGLGLIGGSIARGIKRSRRDVRIMAYMRSRDKLEQAKRDGVVDVILDGIGEEISWSFSVPQWSIMLPIWSRSARF